MQDTARTRAQDMIGVALAKIQRLRSTGPNPFDYWLWADETTQMLHTIFGPDVESVKAFAAVVYERGRTIDQRGSFDNMTLGIHGEWGILARLQRAEPLLIAMRAGLSAAS